MRRILLSLAIVAMVATSAQATAFVWWQMDSGPAGSSATGGVQGQTLNITGPAGDYNLSIWIATDAALATQGTTAYRNNLWRSNAGLTMVGDPMGGGLLNPLGWTGTSGYTAGSQNSGDALVLNWGRARASGQTTISASNSPIKVYTLTVNVGTAGLVADIFQTVGASLYGWAPVTPTSLNQVAFGPNAAVYGGLAANAMPTNAVAMVHFIPEPTTLALLGLGLIGLIRRR